MLIHISRYLRRRLAIALAFIFGCACSAPGAADNLTGGTVSNAAYEKLLSKARTNGTVRIVVTLRMDFQAEGNLPNSQAVQVQRQSIAALQNAVLERLAPYGVSSLRRYKYIPSLAMEVDAQALKVLIEAPEVASIAEDIAVPPLGPE
jgi:hypothetical protein